jgi:hypothetical protein
MIDHPGGVEEVDDRERRQDQNDCDDESEIFV